MRPRCLWRAAKQPDAKKPARAGCVCGVLLNLEVAAQPPLSSVFQFRRIGGLPLHVGGGIGSARTKRRDVVHNEIWARSVRFAGRGARVGPFELIDGGAGAVLACGAG